MAGARTLVGAPGARVSWLEVRSMRKTIGTAALSLFVLAASMPVARAAVPSERADATWMVRGVARVARVAGGLLWVGGDIDAVLRPDGSLGRRVPGLVALGPRTGAPARVRLPRLGTNSTIFDMSVGPGGTLYLAGSFRYSKGGRSGANLVGIDPKRGRIVRVFSAPRLWSVLATRNRIYAGGHRLLAYRPDGPRAARFAPVELRLDDTLRGHDTSEKVRDLVLAANDLIAIGKFDYINDAPQKVAVKVDPRSGRPLRWAIDRIPQDSAAFGFAGVVRDDWLYVAAGGSDFTAAYRLSDGAQVWKTDTSGSSQALTIFDRSTLIVGGHFEWVARMGGQTCGSNDAPNTECFFQPRLAALDLATGRVSQSWTPEICCNHNGVWGVTDRRGRLHVSGAFTRAGGRAQEGYARFSS